MGDAALPVEHPFEDEAPPARLDPAEASTALAQAELLELSPAVVDTPEVAMEAELTEAVPTEPAPTEPAPTEPVPTEEPTMPLDPVPTEPAPTEPAPMEDAPTEAVPTEPAPMEDGLTDPVSTEPVPMEDAPTEMAPPEASEALPADEPTADAPTQASEAVAAEEPTEEALTEAATTEQPTEETPAEAPGEDVVMASPEKATEVPNEEKRWWTDSGFDFTNAAEDSGDDDYETTGSELLGKRVRRTFGKRTVSYGVVLSWLPAAKNEGQAFYRVKHDDGDEEDLELPEVEEAMAAYKKDPDNGAPPEPVKETKEEKMLADETAPAYSGPPSPWLEAGFRALEWAAKCVEDEKRLKAFGGEAVQCFGDVGHSAPDPIRGLALYHVERLAQRWKRAFKKPGIVSEGEAGSNCDVLVGLYGLERAGVGHPELKEEWRAFSKTLKAAKGEKACAALLGYDPKSDDGTGPTFLEKKGVMKSRFRAMTWALLTTHYADRLGLDVFAQPSDVAQHLPLMRQRYQGPRDVPFEVYLDQMGLIVATVMVASNFGELRLLPSALPHEYAQLVDPHALAAAQERNDVHLAADLCRCARLFAANDDLAKALVDRATQFLVACQRNDGGFPTRDDDEHPYTRFHAAITAASALYDPVFRGFGPASTKLKDIFSAKANYAASGVKLLDATGMRALARALYDGAGAAPTSSEKDDDDDEDERGKTLDLLASNRLAGLLKWKTAVDANSVDDYRATFLARPPATSRRTRRRLR